MKAVFVESYNGYTARNESDNMCWTPSLDKKIFKLLTFAFGGVCVVSKHTYSLLPQKMLNDGRKFIVADRSVSNSLQMLNIKYPNAVLIGGVAFLQEAYKLGVIDTFIVTTVDKEIEPNERYKNPFKFKKPECVIPFDDMIIRIYKEKQK